MGAAPLRAVDYRIWSLNSQDRTDPREGPAVARKTQRLGFAPKFLTSDSCQAHQLRFGYLFSTRRRTATMRQIGNPATKTSENADRRLGRVRAALFGFVAFVMTLQAVVLASPWAQSASHEEIAAVSIAAVVDCAQDDSRLPASDGHAHKCSLAGLCCLAGCEAQTFALPGAAFSLAPWSRLATDAVKPHDPARSRLALAGWASAWSSRAPPQTA
ncbi:hypothetical protein D1O30_13480 [Methylocystis hirsuta]|uniref:DUF2946 domain-containing protein n=1 Tax=Methylocystis hirsuta TaxID=369798 RepID=A0A3M9XQD1_9HYPH|nr:hypothetical protein D1O30_13480 [Methylocystis hirsuta]